MENCTQNQNQIARISYCTVGWVDIGTAARVPLNVVVYLRKVEEMT
jgi:hypothetical protein